MTDYQRIKIKEMRESGHGYSDIACDLGLTKDSVKAFCRTHELGGVIAVTEKAKSECLFCGKTVLQDPSRKQKKYCSDKCRMSWWNSHPELVKRKKLAHLTCTECGEPFDSKNPLQKYCSRVCYGKARKEADND